MDSALYSLVNSGSSVPAVPADEATRPIDWTEEARTDLPMRSPERIQHLLKFENHQQTLARITNDLQRYQHARIGMAVRNPQSVQVDPGAKVSSVATWGN